MIYWLYQQYIEFQKWAGGLEATAEDFEQIFPETYSRIKSFDINISGGYTGKGIYFEIMSKNKEDIPRIIEVIDNYELFYINEYGFIESKRIDRNGLKCRF